eukprot:15185444-Ditylum_brightwellii.AAC.1
MVGGSICLVYRDDGCWVKDAGKAFSGCIDDHTEKNGLAGSIWLLCLQMALLSPNTLSTKAEHSRALPALGCSFLIYIRHAAQ